jgi:hypothetical protein
MPVDPHQPAPEDPWTAGRLVALAVATLVVAVAGVVLLAQGTPGL